MRFMVYQVLCSSKATVFYTIGAVISYAKNRIL